MVIPKSHETLSFYNIILVIEGVITIYVCESTFLDYVDLRMELFFFYRDDEDMPEWVEYLEYTVSFQFKQCTR